MFVFFFIFLFSVDLTSSFPVTDYDGQVLFHSTSVLDNTDGWFKDSMNHSSPMTRVFLRAGQQQWPGIQVNQTRMRRSSGCIRKKMLQFCGQTWITTVECRKRSLTCISSQNVFPGCIPQKTYFAACGQAFDTDCNCS